MSRAAIRLEGAVLGGAIGATLGYPVVGLVGLWMDDLALQVMGLVGGIVGFLTWRALGFRSMIEQVHRDE